MYEQAHILNLLYIFILPRQPVICFYAQIRNKMYRYIMFSSTRCFCTLCFLDQSVQNVNEVTTNRWTTYQCLYLSTSIERRELESLAPENLKKGSVFCLTFKTFLRVFQSLAVKSARNLVFKLCSPLFADKKSNKITFF
jgi:hypothetical protein